MRVFRNLNIKVLNICCRANLRVGLGFTAVIKGSNLQVNFLLVCDSALNATFITTGPTSKSQLFFSFLYTVCDSKDSVGYLFLLLYFSSIFCLFS